MFSSTPLSPLKLLSSPPNPHSNDPNFSVGEDMPPPPTAPSTPIMAHSQPFTGRLVQRNYSPATVPPPMAPTTNGNDCDGAPMSTFAGDKTRPRSSNVAEPRPVFDDMLFM